MGPLAASKGGVLCKFMATVGGGQWHERTGSCKRSWAPAYVPLPWGRGSKRISVQSGMDLLWHRETCLPAADGLAAFSMLEPEAHALMHLVWKPLTQVVRGCMRGAVCRAMHMCHCRDASLCFAPHKAVTQAGQPLRLQGRQF